MTAQTATPAAITSPPSAHAVSEVPRIHCRHAASVTKDAGAWNKGSLAENYATGPNPDTFCSIAGFKSMSHFLPEHAVVLPPPAVLSLLMPAVLQRHDGTELCIVQALALYRSSEVSELHPAGPCLKRNKHLMCSTVVLRMLKHLRSGAESRGGGHCMEIQAATRGRRALRHRAGAGTAFVLASNRSQWSI